MFEVSGYSFNSSVSCRGAVFKEHPTVALVVLHYLDATRGYAVYTDHTYSYFHIIHKGFLFLRVFELRMTLKGKMSSEIVSYRSETVRLLCCSSGQVIS